MRTPKYISPSALSKYLSDREQYYLDYLADNRPPRQPQTPAMAIGSGFDAAIKCCIANEVLDVCPDELMYERLKLDSVEAHNLTPHQEAYWLYIFDKYLASGSMADLIRDMEIGQHSILQGTVAATVSCFTQEVPLLCKPDLFCVGEDDFITVMDWKTKGLMGSTNVSPTPKYVRVRDSWGLEAGKPGSNKDMPHKAAAVIKSRGMEISSVPLEEIDRSWAIQLTIGAWCIAKAPEEDFLGVIHQIVPHWLSTSKNPYVRVAQYYARPSKEFIRWLKGTLDDMWNAIQSGYIFTDLTVEENDERIQSLDKVARIYEDSPWIAAMEDKGW